MPIDNEEHTTNRRSFYHLRIPNKDSYYPNGNIHYNATAEIWTCMICNQKSRKYNREQIIAHVNLKRSKRKQETRLSRSGETEDGFAINKALAFGRIRLEMIYSEETNDFGRYPKCTCANCPYATKDKGK